MNDDYIARRKLDMSIDGEFVLGENLVQRDEKILMKKAKEFGDEKMKRIKPTIKYQTVSLSKPFIDAVKEIVVDDPKYRSIADFVRESIREKMDRKVETYVDRSAIRDEKFLFCPFCGEALR